MARVQTTPDTLAANQCLTTSHADMKVLVLGASGGVENTWCAWPAMKAIASRPSCGVLMAWIRERAF